MFYDFSYSRDVQSLFFKLNFAVIIHQIPFFKYNYFIKILNTYQGINFSLNGLNRSKKC